MQSMKSCPVLCIAIFGILCGGCGASNDNAEKPATPPEAVAAQSQSGGALPAPGTMVALPAVPVFPRELDSARDRIRNGGFEEPLDAQPPTWVIAPEGGVPLTIDPLYTAEGDKALRFSLSNSGEFRIAQDVPLSEQADYTVHAAVLPRNVNGSFRFFARDADGARFSVESDPVAGNAIAWEPFSFTFSPPAYVTKLSLGFQYAAAQKLYEGDSVLLLDRVKLIERAPVANRIQNGDFTQGPKGEAFWNVAPGLTITQEDSGFVAGTPKCIRVDLPGNANLGVYQTVGGLTPGARYVCRAYIKTKDLLGEACIEFHHGEKGFSAFMHRTPGVTGTSAWTWVRTEFTLPNDATSITVLLRRPGDDRNPATPGTVWFAKCELFGADEAR